jgi:ATP-dependent DNA helicase RecG
MMEKEPSELLRELLALPHETEWVEFKEARSSYDFDDLGKYFSALSNEANLKGQPAGWLVFGVTDKPPRRISGSHYRLQRPGLDRLKQEIAQHTNHQITFVNIHELTAPEGRVILFRIPPAPRGMPTTWNGIAYGRIHESLAPLSLQEIEQIRRQTVQEDWSAQVCERASLRDLDPQAIGFARQEYKNKFHPLAAEVDQWDDLTFLNKAKVCVSGQLTRTAVILLGRNEAEHLLSPAIARITWVLKDAHGGEKDYRHFGPPVVLAVDQVFAQIRNLTYRHLPDASLFPTEISQYDAWVIRETLHNAIAHQDYTQGGRINVVEEPESLLFTNVGEFLPGSVEEVIRRDAPPEFYRNRFLAEAMVNLNMIDTIGSGIKRMFTKQRQRYFPLPDYDLSEPGRVKVRIIGKVLDERYTRLLGARSDLSLTEVLALDKVQKGKALTDEEFRLLRKKRLVEGRRPNLIVSAEIAAATETRADYIKKRAFDKDHYKKMVFEYLRQFHVATRPELDTLLLNKLSDALEDKQKRNLITNLLQEMRRSGIIRPVGGKRGKGAKWELCKPAPGGSD